MAVLRSLYDANGEALDRGLVLWFPGPASFTGEDMAELHVHGGRAVVQEVLGRLGDLDGLRAAEPGDFTRRAFDNGKLDLAEVEGLADLIDAETAAQRKQALRQLGGYLSDTVADWRIRLTRTLAHLEAAIDFSDEDLPESLWREVHDEIAALTGEIDRTLADAHRGERLREGFHIAIVGAPNAGKSSLLNALARRDAAIVAETAGTTRDVVEVHLDLGGYAVILADTAGLRDVAGDGDAIEREGIRRAHAKAADADLKLALFDVGDPASPDPATVSLVDRTTLVVASKTDRFSGPPPVALAGHACIPVSARTGAGLADLLATLTEMLGARADTAPDEAPAITRVRHRHALDETRAALTRAAAAPLPELAAEDLRLASRALGRITGQVDVEDLLDVIFSDFCIGK